MTSAKWESVRERMAALKVAIATVIVGQDEVVELLLTALLCKGHSLLVGVPGLAKTLPVTESDLRGLSTGEIRSLGVVAAGSGRELRRWQEGIELWPHLPRLALALLLVEGLVVTSHLWWHRVSGDRDG